MGRVRWFLLLGLLAGACGGEEALVLKEDPQTLRETGLFTDFATEELAPGVFEYAPAYDLWADGATKRRWVFLPEGETIDSSDMDFWNLPVDTRLWKEFVVDSERIETRLIWKKGEGDWMAKTFLWNEAQDAAEAVADGEPDVRGTGYSVPTLAQCDRCHKRQPDYALGFSAIALSGGTGLALDELVNAGALSTDPLAPIALPGDATAKDALGTLHVNCGGCHHPGTPEFDQSPMELRLTVAGLGTVEDTKVFLTTVGVTPRLTTVPRVTALVKAGDPDASAVTFRMNVRGERADMPPVASDVVDADGLASVRAWISSLN